MSIRIHFFQHVPFENPGYILDWCMQKDVKVSFTRFYENGPVPDPGSYDCLVIMGGPMGVYDEKDYPWLITEKKAIAAAIAGNKPVMGICLGAQLLAASLGARVYQNPVKEIGWFDIDFNASEQLPSFFKTLKKQSLQVFHWHGDTFDLPEKALLMASSKATRNQAFLYGDRVIGFQFHLEVTEANLMEMIQHGGKELVKGGYIQDSGEILGYKHRIPEINQLMGEVMEWIMLMC